jgi:endonuclease/exonuclease/phosphatase family metal-dependent hydrolase
LGQTLRVLSANLWNGRADPDAFAALVSSLAVDVVAVQELAPEQAEALGAVMPYGQLEPKTDCTGMGLVASAPCQLERVPLPSRDAHVAHFEAGAWPDLSSPLEIMNVHVVAPHAQPFGGALAVRRSQWRALEAYLSKPPAGARALVGDLNATPAWPFYWRVAERMTDAAVAVAKSRGTPPLRTWGPRPGFPRLLRIDHGFVDGIEVDNFQVLPLERSDHSAIVMDLLL